MPTWTKAERRAAFEKLAADVGTPDVSVLAGTMDAPSGTAVAVARRWLGGVNARGVGESRVSRLAVKFDRLVAADRGAAVTTKRANGGR